jgi:hypothetical protein
MITTSAPYAAADQITKVLARFRETPFGGAALTPALVAKLQMGDEVARRVILSLKQLELIDSTGMPTEALLAFEKAPTDEYLSVLAAHLYAVYAPIFDVLGRNISDRSMVEIEDQFRTYTPKTLRGRMATCFLGLCKYAGIIEKVPKGTPGPKAPRGATNSGTASRTAQTRTGATRPPKREQATDQVSIKGATELVSSTLSSGGELVIAMSGKVSDLTASERQKVFDLFDEVKMLGIRPALMSGDRKNNEETNP